MLRKKKGNEKKVQDDIEDEGEEEKMREDLKEK